MMKKIYTLLLGIGILASVHASDEPPEHDAWNTILQKHVSESGLVDYQAIKENKSAFYAYLRMLTQHHPEDSWTREEKMAYWINAYNAFTVQLIIKHYPVESITKLGGAFEKPWDVKFIKIQGRKYSLNDIEHNILRKEFSDSRIHFAVNCASYSCPKLRNEAYTASALEQQLEEQTEAFINNDKYNRIGKNKVEVSKLFDWYKEDFTREGSLIDFLNKYSNTVISKGAAVDYMDYNWSLNDQN